MSLYEARRAERFRREVMRRWFPVKPRPVGHIPADIIELIGENPNPAPPLAARLDPTRHPFRVGKPA